MLAAEYDTWTIGGPPAVFLPMLPMPFGKHVMQD